MGQVAKGAAIAAIVLASTPALAAPASQGVRISARVPAVCNIAADNFTLDESGTLSGTVNEFCNTSSSYAILASYRPLANTEAATVRYGTRTTQLDDAGQSAVAFRSGQRIEAVPVTIAAQDLSAPLTIAFTLSAI